MQLSCPNCGTRDVRVAQRRGMGEYLRGLIGIYPLRCRRCKTRWETSAWANAAWKYARCPKCYRQQLTTWSLKFYNPPALMRMKLQLGGSPFRCAACRCNFVSFRPRKERVYPEQNTEQNAEQKG